MAKPVFTILMGGSDNPFETVELTNDTRQYVHVRLNNIVKTYDDEGNMTKTNNYSPVVRCSEEFLSETAFEKNFFKNSGSVDHCVEDPSVYL